MIAMAFLDVSCNGDEVITEYSPAKDFLGKTVGASIAIRMFDKSVHVAGLILSIEESRVLSESLAQLVMLHDAAERLAAEKAVA